jgi:hypothetical protein
MRPIGFSTGALAYGDFRLGLKILSGTDATAIELSALREAELGPLVGAIDSLDLGHFRYVSVHAPSRYEKKHEPRIIALLKKVHLRHWPIIVHPDTLHDLTDWNSFGDLLLVENMDKRNFTGRTSGELAAIFSKLPNAQLCFDLGHARQVDPTMTESYSILTMFRTRLRQLHISEVNSSSTHDRLSEASMGAFEKISHLIPADVPVILESPVTAGQVKEEMTHAQTALATNGGASRSASHEPHPRVAVV